MINYIWFFMLSAGIITAAGKGQIHLVTEAVVKGSQQAVLVAAGLIGIISFWSGMMRIAQEAGLIEILSRAMSPCAKLLFPEIPPGHPAMGALLLSFSANLLGLGNACTPLGLKTMEHLQDLNRDKEKASRAQCTFMIITSSSLTVIPSTIIALRTAHGSRVPTDIIGSVLVATFCSTLAALFADRLLRHFF
ncbi:MAG: hypothetical protein GX335_09380 [Firmicutes bacterium]|nr:hypothetical protein [Bacillota bacterium]